jgi:hypothetical protein
MKYVNGQTIFTIYNIVLSKEDGIKLNYTFIRADKWPLLVKLLTCLPRRSGYFLQFLSFSPTLVCLYINQWMIALYNYKLKKNYWRYHLVSCYINLSI